MSNSKDRFVTQGFLKLEKLLTQDEVDDLRSIYDELLKNIEGTRHLRSDLAGAGGDGRKDNVERITQIMRPSSVVPGLNQKPVYQKALRWAQKLHGEDMALDFDMLINKAPHTDTPTPWHQDAAYWIDMPDKRAVSCWIALDEVYEENGCMWFVPRSDDQILHDHKNLPNGGALYCEADTIDAEPVPLHAGGCTFHDGFTLHYSHGNSTDHQRRALILNFRPEKMIELERSQGVDHTGEQKFKNEG